MTVPAMTGVLFIDLQEGLVEAGKIQPADDLRRAVGALRAVASILALPCRATVIPAAPDRVAPLIAELGTATPFIEPIPRRTINAISAVADDCVDLVLSGIAMEGAILHTALAARRQGLKVHVPIDACTGLSRRTEDAAIRQMEAAGVVTTSVASLATGWLDTASLEQSMAVMKELRRLLD